MGYYDGDEDEDDDNLQTILYRIVMTVLIIAMLFVLAIIFKGCQLVEITIHQNAIMDKGDNSSDDFTKSEAKISPSDQTSITVTPKIK